MGIRKTITNLLIFCNKESPTILTGFGIVGVLGTGYLSYRAGVRAHDIIERHHEDMELVDEDDKEAKRIVMGETVKEMVPVVMPPLIMGAFTIGCIFMSNHINSKRIAVLATAYGYSEKKLKEYENKMSEMLGEKKTQDIRESISKDNFTEFEKEHGPILPYNTGFGEMPTVDEFTKRVFPCTIPKIDSAVSKLTQQVYGYGEDYVSLNDLYDELGLERIPQGDRFGWISDDILTTGKLPLYGTPFKTEDGIIAINLEYDLHARRDFRELSR